MVSGLLSYHENDLSFYLYQMQKIKELLKGHSILRSLSMMSTFKSLKPTFNEVALNSGL